MSCLRRQASRLDLVLAKDLQELLRLHGRTSLPGLPAHSRGARDAQEGPGTGCMDESGECPEAISGLPWSAIRLPVKNRRCH
jgi:hypothetical protein